MLQKLIGARKQLGLTQAEMAKQLGVSRNYLALIETDQRKIPPSVMDWLVTFLKQKSGEPINSSVDPPRAPPGPCHLCAEKSARIGELERERDFLRDQVSGLVTALAQNLPCRAADSSPDSR